LEKRECNGLVFYQSTLLDDVRHGIFTRLGGVSAAPFDGLNLGGNVGDDPKSVRENHLRMYATLEVDDRCACTVWQVHSADVIVASRPVAGRRWLARADAMITDQIDIPLSMRFADCTPILFYEPIRRVIGLAHAGWRGTVAAIASRVVQTMCQAYDLRPEAIRAVIGPAIGPNRYQVGEEVVAAVTDQYGMVDGLVKHDPHDGTAYLNLWAANHYDLTRAGVGKIEVAEICTAENTHEFFSHRAEQGRTGRFGAVVCL